MVAGNIMPFGSISIEIVKDGKAGFIISSFTKLTIIGLTQASTSCVGPFTTPTGVLAFNRNTSIGTRPEPSVDIDGLQVGSVTSIEIALATRGPDVFNIALLNAVNHKFGFIFGFYAHKILTVLPADVSGIKPIPLVVLGGSMYPREEVVMSIPECGSMSNTIGTSPWFWRDKLPLCNC